MIASYFQNMNVGMTKDQYFEMMEQLGSEPVEEEVPVEMDDFPAEVQQAFQIYFKLKDDWDTFNGNYMGKSLMGLKDILEIYSIEAQDRTYILDWVSEMDNSRQKIFKTQKPKSTTKTPKE
jgi:hypothetical protein